MTPEDIAHQKEVEYYAASVTAWFNTSLEHDKSVLTLAAGGIGLLITLLTTVGLSSAEALILYISAITSFLVALVAVLVVFRRNRSYIEQVLAGNAAMNDPLLAKADATALWSFGLGVVFTAIIGIATAVHSYTSKENVVTSESNKSTQTQSVPLRESFNGASNLQVDVARRSFNGAGSLQPQATTGANNSNATTPAASPSSPTTPTSQSQGGKQP
jgi:hypothetical protein